MKLKRLKTVTSYVFLVFTITAVYGQEDNQPMDGAYSTEAYFVGQLQLEEYTYHQMDSLNSAGKLVLKSYGIIPANYQKTEKFKKKYGVGYIQETCVNIQRRSTSLNNHAIVDYLDRKYGKEWRGLLPATPCARKKKENGKSPNKKTVQISLDGFGFAGEQKLFSARLSDTGFLTSKVSEVEDTLATYFTFLVDLDLLDRWQVQWENTLHPYVTTHFSDGKGFGSTSSSQL